MLKKMRLIISLIIPLCFVFAAGQGLQLIHADKHSGRMLNGEQQRIFSGNVHFQQDTIHMYCDEAIFYENEDRVDFIGNVRIDNGIRRIRARKIEYYPDTKLAVCLKEVRITSPGDSLYAEYFSYHFDTEKARAETNVFIYNHENHTRIWGQKGFYFPDQKLSRIQVNARLMRADSSSRDTLNITAGQIDYYDLDQNPRSEAIDSVVITQQQLRAVCDTAIYYVDEEKVDLIQIPRVWYEESTLSGDRMQAFFDSLKLHTIYVFGNARATSLADSINQKYNILKGRNIHFFVENNQPKKVTAVDNASSIYYLNEEKRDQGSNFATADTIHIFFEEGKLDSIRIIGGAEGVYYPDNYKGEKVFEQ